MIISPGFELYDHTADLGVRVVAPTLAGLIPPATDGLYATIGDLAPEGEPGEVRLRFDGDDAADMFRDYLAELLALLETEHRIATHVDVSVFSAHSLEVQLQMAALDAKQSVYAREVKAITYHELAIRPIAGGFEATYIVDI